MQTKINIREVKLVCVRPKAEPNAVQVDAYIGDLYLGQHTFYSSSIANAKTDARNRIRRLGSLN